jgi:hypothetical protein
LLPPDERREEDDEPPDFFPPPGLIMSAAVGLTPSTVFAADSIAVFVKLEARSATSDATPLTCSHAPPSASVAVLKIPPSLLPPPFRLLAMYSFLLSVTKSRKRSVQLLRVVYRKTRDELITFPNSP